MEVKKKAVALSDDALDVVSGGVIIQETTVTNKITGEVYQLLVDPQTCFMYMGSLGGKTEAEKIAALMEKGYIA